MVALRGLTSALTKLGVHCEVAAVTGQKDGGGDLSSFLGTTVHHFDTGFLARFWPAYSRQLSRFLDERLAGAFDLVHIKEIWHYPCYAAYRAARRRRVPYVLSFLGALDEWRLRTKGLKKGLYMRMIQGRVIRSADALHALTQQERARIRKLGFRGRVFVSPNGADLITPTRPLEASAFIKSRPELRDKRVILFMGRIHAMKGLEALARGFAMIAGRFPDAALVVAGPEQDDSRATMESALESAGLRGRVTFTGALTGDDKLAALKRADLFVLPSHSEGFSNAILEAMAAGTPVVISEQCNFPEAAQSSAGLVIENTGAAVAEAMSALLSDETMRRRMGENGRELVAHRYTWASVAGSMLGHYRRIMEDRSGKEGVTIRRG